MIPFAVFMFVVGMLIFLVWWLFFETEGVFFGRRVVIWLYDLYASRYDKIVQNNDTEEHLYIAQPLMRAVEPHGVPLVLDVATGNWARPPRAVPARPL